MPKPFKETITSIKDLTKEYNNSTKALEKFKAMNSVISSTNKTTRELTKSTETLSKIDLKGLTEEYKNSTSAMEKFRMLNDFMTDSTRTTEELTKSTELLSKTFDDVNKSIKHAFKPADDILSTIESTFGLGPLTKVLYHFQA